MAKYSIELRTLLRGFSPANEKPGLYVSPRSLIEISYKEFFKAIGSYHFKIWGDERDQAFKDQFEKDFLEYFFMKEINYATPDAFYLELGSFLRRKMPIYCSHWKHILSEMYVTSTGTVEGKSNGLSVNNDNRQTDSNSKGNTHAVTDSRYAELDAPQSRLNLDLDNLKYASKINRSDSDTNTDTKNEDHSTSEGNSTGTTENENVTKNFSRGKDVFDIYDEWLKSGYDLFTPLYYDAINEKLFMIFN